MCRAKLKVPPKKSPQSHQTLRDEHDETETPVQGQATLESQVTSDNSGTLIGVINNNSDEQVEEIEVAQVSVSTPTESIATTEVADTSGIMTCRLVIPAATAGLLIGRQGCNITRLKVYLTFVPLIYDLFFIY